MTKRILGLGFVLAMLSGLAQHSAAAGAAREDVRPTTLSGLAEHGTAGEVAATNAVATPATATPTNAPSAKPTPGIEAAQAISTITGVAISPLLGVGAVGAVKYFNTPEAARGKLPWFARPWFWVPALVLVLLVCLKDVFGTTAPTILKKPFDVAEVFENKISALIVAGAFVPFVATVFQSISDDGSLAAEMGLATIDGTSLLNLLTVPLALVAFFVVWMVSHVINVLILVSPFGTVDALLKFARLSLLSTVALSSLVNPYFGAAVSLVVILIACFLAGWSMRLTVFGNVFAWDLLTLRHARFTVGETADRAFTARRIQKVPVRTCGRVRRDEQGRLVFEYRPWLILPKRTLVLPEGDFSVGRGMLYPEVLHLKDGVAKRVLTLPPRFRTHEERFAKAYGMAGVQDVGLIKGIKAFWSWLKGAFTLGRKAVPVPA
ncbi:MAG TPA: hypothetical protein VFT34_04475 [Verrucomicrobiae bacterium]|nr:hypothetical protein [Verrucomicrobiae bacterium]